MNVKVSIELPERYLEFAEEMVRSGAYGSISEMIQEDLRERMLSRHDEPSLEQMDSVTAMADEIRRRMASPPDQWVEMDESDTMFDDLRARLRQRYGADRK